MRHEQIAVHITEALERLDAGDPQATGAQLNRLLDWVCEGKSLSVSAASRALNVPRAEVLRMLQDGRLNAAMLRPFKRVTAASVARMVSAQLTADLP